MSLADRLTTQIILLLPGAGVVYFAFNAGGFFPDSVAFGALVLVAALVVRVMLADSPFEGFSVPLAIGAAGLGLFALWTLLSGRWSHAPGRALIEFDRALLFFLALVLFGSLRRSSSNLRRALWGLGLAIGAVCITGLATRVLPDVFPVTAALANDRLSYPVTYWNSLGLLAAIGIILCFHFASSEREPPIVRVLGAVAVPVLAATLYFTFSRGAIAAGIVGLGCYIVVGRPRVMLSGLLATVPAAVIAVVVAYDADLLATTNPTTPAAANQGHAVAFALGIIVVVTALLRTLLLRLDSRDLSLGLRERLAPRVLASVGAAVALVGIVSVLALDIPGGVADQYDRFVGNGSSGPTGGDLRARLTNPANNGRVDSWRVAYDAFRDKPLKGNGAGTYENLWSEHRPLAFFVRDAHSLYVEALGELGVVGGILLAAALFTILGMLGARSRGTGRTLYPVVLAAALTWAIRAGIDWDWEMPVVTLWLFAIGGLALARNDRAPRPPLPAVRTATAVACVAIGIVPGLVLVSQTRLEAAADAFIRGDCAAATKEAGSSISALGNRSEPYEIRGYCRIRDRSPRQAIGEFQKALDLDPQNWTYHYDLALARGAAGLDPRGESREAARLNPLNADAQGIVKSLRGRSPAAWKRQARALLSGASPFYLSER